jgi:DNA-binding transcriptional regulator YiaG
MKFTMTINFEIKPGSGEWRALADFGPGSLGFGATPFEAMQNLAEHLEEYAVNRAVKSFASSRNRSLLTNSQIAQIRELNKDRKITQTQIAAKFGINTGTVHRICRWEDAPCGLPDPKDAA